MPGGATLAWLPEALDDLQRLHRFLQAKNPAAANRFLLRIRASAQTLAKHPEIGRPYAPAPMFRELFVPFGARGYLIRYRNEEARIIVVRVWHALEDR